MPEVKFDDLLDAFEFVSTGNQFDQSAYIDTETGEIIVVADELEPETAPPDDLETSDRYLAIPHKHDLDLGRALVMSFVEQTMPDKIAAVSGYFRKRGAYARYKDLLESHGLLERWYAFEAEATRHALREWCKNNAIALAETGA